MIRYAEKSDYDALTALWHEVFGDGEEFIRSFLGQSAAAGFGVVFEDGGKVSGMAFVLEGLMLNELRGAYIYAVATDEKARGQGIASAVVSECASAARARGADFICTSPDGDGLYGWYERVIGTRAAGFCSEQIFDAAPSPLPVRKIGAAEYARRREELLKNTPHIVFGAEFWEIQKMLCEFYGGGLFAAGGGIGFGYVECDTAQLRELFTPEEEFHAAASAVAQSMGARRAAVRVIGGDKAIIAAAPRDIFPEKVWFGAILD